MKLYAFIPDGHGSKSMFICAESELEARVIVDIHVAKNGLYYYEGWGTSYYTMEVFAPGQVVENDND